MLSAASESNRSFEFIKAVLSLMSKHSQVPENALNQFIKVMEQARVLAADPSNLNNINKELLPESINLALELQSHNDFMQEINSVEDFHTISPQLAARLLTRMQEERI